MRAARIGIIIGSVGIVMASAVNARAQGSAAPATPPDAGMAVHGSVDVGGRTTDVTGSTDMYNRIFNLQDGVRLMGFEMSGTAPRDGKSFADSFGVSLSGIGDPFPALQLTLRKAHRYDIRGNWRQSSFVDTWPLTPSSMGGLDTQAVVDHHAWTTKRQIGSASAVFDATSNLHLLFNYSRTSRSGTMLSTRSLDFVGSPTIWGTFARANPYPVTTPADDTADRAVGGLSYSSRAWTLIYQAGYQRYHETRNFSGLSALERSINVADPTTANELLTNLSDAQSRRLASPASELTFVARPSSRFEWRGDYLYYRYRGPYDLNATYQGTARTDSGATVLSPYTIALTAHGETSAPSHVIDQRVTYRLASKWSAGAEYRYARFTSEGEGTLTSAVSTFPTPTPSTSLAEELSWRQVEQSLRLELTFEPMSSLSIRPAVRLAHRDVEERADDVINTGTTMKTKTVWPEVTVAYRPSSIVEARGSYRTANSDTSYTRLSPVDRTIAHLSVRVQPTENLSIEANADQTDGKLPAAAFVSNTRVGAVQASYKFGERISAMGGLDYQSFLGKGSVSFLRGTAPIVDDAMVDREKDRIWLVGARVRPMAGLEAALTANFMRTTGTDSIAGEPPLYGPETFPYGTGSISYDVRRAGRVTAELQMAHLYQDILPMNNFRARLFTVRFSREF